MATQHVGALDARTKTDHRLPSRVVRIDGAADISRSGRGGVDVRRLPPWTRSQMPDPITDLVLGASCGIRLVVQTAATTLRLRMHTTGLQLPGESSLLINQVIDVVVDGRHVRRVPVRVNSKVVVAKDNALSTVDGPATTTVIAGLTHGDKQVEIWLPNGTSTTVVSLSADTALEPPAPDDRRRWLHHGSSLSQGLEAGGMLSTWPVRVATSRGMAIDDWAFAGNAMLDPFVARSIAARPVDTISVELGVNIHNGAAMTARTFGPAVHGFLDTIRDGHQTTPITVISPTPIPAAERTPGPMQRTAAGAYQALGHAADVTRGALTMNAVRDTLRRIVAARHILDPNLHYVDGRDLLRVDEHHLLVDGLHPGPDGHLVMATRFDRLWCG